MVFFCYNRELDSGSMRKGPVGLGNTVSCLVVTKCGGASDKIENMIVR